MKRILSGIASAFKISGTYLTILAVSVLLLAFERKPKTPLVVLECDDYAAELQAQKVELINSYYGAEHFEVTLAHQVEEPQLISSTLFFARAHDFAGSRFLYLTPEGSVYIVVNERYEIYVER